MKSLLIFCAMFVFASARPGALIHTHVVQAPIVAAPLLTKIEGQAPASTIHAVHAKLVPQVIAYSSVPHIVSAPIVSSPVISAYSVTAPLPFVSFSSIRSIESLHSLTYPFILSCQSFAYVRIQFNIFFLRFYSWFFAGFASNLHRMKNMSFNEQKSFRRL